ncbi:hypothetical protein [Ferruginibacter albus]|uniref:hypothetical protein n=1 Tax=Ferruginibacter albus TaxID=2875540 RepID=UPI001CC4A641|nr:hypothetical protein [Ferruginibacter albus]UAY50978.1 hypothetical protein K9M53_10300 [Ferruginibacter albus]
MNAKKFLIGGVVAGIIYFLLGWLAYGNLLVPFFYDHPGLTTGFKRDTPLYIYIIAGNLLFGFLLSYIFVRTQVNTFGDGFRRGAVIGFLASSSYDSLQYATTTLTTRPAVLVDVITFTVISAIAGAIAAIASGSGAPELS